MHQGTFGHRVYNVKHVFCDSSSLCAVSVRYFMDVLDAGVGSQVHAGFSGEGPAAVILQAGCPVERAMGQNAEREFGEAIVNDLG